MKEFLTKVWIIITANQFLSTWVIVSLVMFIVLFESFVIFTCFTYMEKYPLLFLIIVPISIGLTAAIANAIVHLV